MRRTPSNSHIPERPSWQCRTCGARWPCAPAQATLRYDYRRDRISLFVYLGQLAVAAAGELPTTVNAVERIVSWARRSP